MKIPENIDQPTFTRLPTIQLGADVDLILSAIQENKGVKGHFVFVEGKVAETRAGPHKKGEMVKFTISMDRKFDMGWKEMAAFLVAANGGVFKPTEKYTAAQVMEHFANEKCRGVAVRVVAAPQLSKEGEPVLGKNGHPYTKYQYYTVSGQTKETIAANIALL